MPLLMDIEEHKFNKLQIQRTEICI